MPEPENHLAVHGAAGEAAAALVRAGEAGGPEAQAEERDTRLDRLMMALHVMVKIDRMRVQDLLALERGSVLTTRQEHSQDVPVRCGRELLMWGEFEVAEQKLAVRITRLE